MTSRRRPQPALIAPRVALGNRETIVPRGEPARKQATLLVRGPNGTERRFEIGARPLTIGSDPECDIVLQGDSVRPLHARITARGSGEMQIHAIRPSNSRPYDRDEGDEWLVVQAGEEITIGDQSLTVVEE